MEDDATGHRYGNFPNYYSFNPPKNRLDVLKRSGILDYILRGLGERTHPSTSRAHSGDGSSAAAVDGGARKKPRLDDSASKKSADGSDDGLRLVRYCDLGCNEGDLTLAMASVLSSGTDEILNSADDKQKSPAKCYKQKVNCLGLDIDPKLIERANSKCYGSPNKLDDDKSKAVHATFKSANLCNAEEHNAATSAFVRKVEEESEGYQDADTIIPHQVFDLTTIFSTTMWIHVHGGDEGLKAFLD